MFKTPNEYAEGNTHVKWCKKAPFPRTVAKRGCLRDGLTFEADVQTFLDRFIRSPEGKGWQHLASKWISYRDDEGTDRHAQPDSLLVNKSLRVVIICEMKLKHTPRSIPQLLHKYRPLITTLYPGYTIIPLEVYKYWDWLVYRATTLRCGNEWDLEGLRGCDIGLVNLVLDAPLVIKLKSK